MPEKVACEVKCIETDDGVRVEIKGEKAKEYLERLQKGEVKGFPGCCCC